MNNTNTLTSFQVKTIMKSLGVALNKRFDNAYDTLKAEARIAIANGDYDNHPDVEEAQEKATKTLIDMHKILDFYNSMGMDPEDLETSIPSYRNKMYTAVKFAQWVYKDPTNMKKVMAELSDSIYVAKENLAYADYGVNTTIWGVKENILTTLRAKLSVMTEAPYDVIEAQLLDPINPFDYFVVEDNITIEED